MDAPFHAALSAEPLDAARLQAALYDAEAGGVAVFVGVTRARRAADDPRVTTALEYDAYGPMAVRELRELLDAARAQWPLVRAVIVHRVGTVAAGEPSVFVGVATPHRGAAFEACRWLIDHLKARVPIWKRECYADGTSEWTGGAWSALASPP